MQYSEIDDINIGTDEIFVLRDRINYYLLDLDYENAVFWTEKLYLLTNSNVDLYRHIQSLISARRFRHALNLMEKKFINGASLCVQNNTLENAPLWVRYFAAKCYSNVGQCDKSLELLHDIIPTVSLQTLKSNTATESGLSAIRSQLFENEKNHGSYLKNMQTNDEFVDHNLLLASAAKLKATIMEYMSDNNATGYFLTSLSKDISNYGSARKLFENKMISPKEVKCFVEEFYNILETQYEKDTSFVKLAKFALAFYLVSSGLSSPSIKKNGIYPDASCRNTFDVNNTNQMIWPSGLINYAKLILQRFSTSLDVMRWQAEALISSDFSSNSLILTQNIINQSNMDDPLACVLHSLTLFKCCRSVDLKVLADLLAADSNISINKQIIYRVVSSIRDLSVGNASQAQDNLRVAVKLSAVAALRLTPWLISPAVLWIILGHAAWLAGDKEHALASFNSAVDISPGLYITWFYIGALHAETEELSLALTYYLKSHHTAVNYLGFVPLFMANEIACTLAKKGDYIMAIQILTTSLSVTANDEDVLLDNMIKKKQPKLYTSLLHNLSYCYLKNKQVEEAFRYAQLANGIYRGSLENQKLYAVLLDHYGQHKNAQFIYQMIVLESSKVQEFKSVTSHEICRRLSTNNTLPPRTNPYHNIKDNDAFCSFMIERSLKLEKETNRNKSCGIFHTAKANNPCLNTPNNNNNTSLSFDIDKTFN